MFQNVEVLLVLDHTETMIYLGLKFFFYFRDVLTNLIKPKKVDAIWIGLDDIGMEGQWYYLDGVKATKNNTNWLPGEPNNSAGKEDCGHFWRASGYKINDRPCSFLCKALCSYEIKQFVF